MFLNCSSLDHGWMPSTSRKVILPFPHSQAISRPSFLDSGNLNLDELSGASDGQGIQGDLRVTMEKELTGWTHRDPSLLTAKQIRDNNFRLLSTLPIAFIFR